MTGASIIVGKAVAICFAALYGESPVRTSIPAGTPVRLLPADEWPLQARPMAIAEGQVVTLSWFNQRGSEVLIEQAPEHRRSRPLLLPIGHFPAKGSIRVSPAVTTMYVISCVGSQVRCAESITITVRGKPDFRDISASHVLSAPSFRRTRCRTSEPRSARKVTMRIPFPPLLGGLLLTTALVAQTTKPDSRELNLRAYVDLLRSDVQKSKAQVMATVMQLDADEATKFWPVYKNFESELSKVGDQVVTLIKNYATHYDNMTPQVADDLATKLLDLERQRNDLKKQYYLKFKTATDPITAMRFLQVENQLERLVDLQIASELPVIEAPGVQP